MRAKITKSTGSWYLAATEDYKIYQCRLAGHFRKRNIKNTNPIAVGDWVKLEPESAQMAIIVELEPRRNYIIRKSVNLSKQAHIIAANLDLSLLIVSLVNPKTLFGFIDRFLATAEAYSIPSLIVVNKTDLHGPNESNELQYFEAVYGLAGYKTLSVSAAELTGIKDLKEILQNKTTLVSGNSGVGKSSLVNAIQPGLGIRTQALSKSHQQGQHTTTFAELYVLDFGGEIIDTPGIKSFGMVDMEKAEIAHYFPEILKHSAQCKYHNCLHIDEPGCAVQAAVNDARIADTRYHNYLKMLESEDESSPYR